MLRVVAVYCPHKQGGDQLVYGQHQHWCHKTGTPHIPRKAFWKDLSTETSTCIEVGDQLIVTRGWNEPVATVKQKYMVHLSSQEILREQYGSGPATYKHSKTTTNGIFITKSPHITQGG